MKSADTNVIVRLIARDDAKQVSAAEQFIAEGAWVSTVVLAEAAWVLESNYGLSRDALADSLELLLGNPVVVLQNPEIVADALKLFHKRPTVGFADCLIVELARHAGHLPLGTFDRTLAKVDGAQLV